MKRYKLIKDLPTFKAGDEFCLNSIGDLVLYDKWIVAYTKLTLDKFPNILTDWFEEITVGYERWRAERGEEYWHIDGFGKVSYGYEGEKSGDIHSDFAHFDYATGNYFKTKEEAEAYQEYLLAKQKLIDSADGYKPVLDGHNHYLEYCNGAFGKHFSIYETTTYTLGVIYFKYQKDAEESFKKYRDEWEIVRKYEMGEK